MANIYPSYYDSKRTSLGEKNFFKILQKLPNSNNWTVLHSLNIANSGKKFCNEIDFLIMASKLGIFCIEVKPGGQERFNGEWYITDFNGKKIKSYRDAFKQASDAKYDLIDEIKRNFRDSKESSYFVSYGIVFPNVTFPVETIEIERWRVCDTDEIDSFSLFLNNLIRHDLDKYAAGRIIDKEKLIPQNHKEINDLLNYLRPNFDRRISYSQSFKDNDLIELELIGDQYGYLMELEKNGKFVINGSPGTGKTILAIESAKRNIGVGKRVLVLCFNNFLGKKLLFELSGLKDQGDFYAGNYYDYLEDILEINLKMEDALELRQKKTHKYYDKLLPRLVIDIISNSKFKKYDLLIIDDFPDILRLNINFKVLDLMLKGGLKNGNWQFFGDLKGQKLFKKKPSEEDIKEKIKSGVGDYTLLPLGKNLRNSEEIILEIRRIFDTKEEAVNYKNQIHGDKVQHIYYSSLTDEAIKLKELLNKIISEGVKEGDVTILTDKKYLKDSCINDPIIQNCFKIINLKSNQEDFFNKSAITFHKIFKFKGAENNCIIIIDIDEGIDWDIFENGMYRAKYKLCLFIDEKSKPKFTNK